MPAPPESPAPGHPAANTPPRVPFLSPPHLGPLPGGLSLGHPLWVAAPGCLGAAGNSLLTPPQAPRLWVPAEGQLLSLWGRQPQQTPEAPR